MTQLEKFVTVKKVSRILRLNGKAGERIPEPLEELYEVLA